MKFKATFLAAILSIFSCSLDLPEEGNYLRWTTTLEIPLVTQEITLKTLAEDSLITIEGLDHYFEDGTATDSIFVYHKEITIEKVEVGDRLEIDPISTSFTQSVDDVTVAGVEKIISSAVGAITLNDIDPSGTDPFIFRNIYPAIEEVPDGLVAIPAFEIAPIVKPFSFDDFGYAEFSGGELQITIENNMVIPLGPPVIVQLRQVIESDTTDIPGATIQFDSIIDANDGSASETMDLTGMTLPGNILVQVSGNCQGTSGIQITIDEEAKNSSFQVTIGGTGMEVAAATARIPQQSIEEEGSITLEPDSNKVVRASIQSGNLIIEVDNYMALGSSLNIAIPSLETPSGTAFQTSLEIPGNTADILDQTSMADHALVMDADDQSVTYSYSVLTVDSGDELIPVTAQDSIVVHIRLEGPEPGSDITFSQFQGYLNQEAMVDSSTITLDNATRVDQATLQSGNMNLSMTNGIGIEAVVNFTIVEFTKNGNSLDTSFALTTDPLNVTIDLSGYLLDLDLEADSQAVHYVSAIDIPSDEEMTLSFGQSIAIEVIIDSLSFAAVSGYVDPVTVDIDTVEQEIDLPAELENLEFAQIEMNFAFQSNIALPVFLDLQLASFNDETGESVVKRIEQVNIIEQPLFSIDSAQHLINIQPNRIVASGTAEVGSLEEYGSVTTADTISGSLIMAAPLAFEINENSRIEVDAEKLESISADAVESGWVFLDYQNKFEFGADIAVLVTTDTTGFENGTADTLTKVGIQADAAGLDSVNLEESKFSLLAREGNYVKAVIGLLGREEGPSRFLATDTMDVELYISVEAILDLNDGGDD